MDVIPELSSRVGQKIKPASEASAQHKYEKLTQFCGIFLHTDSMAFQNIQKNLTTLLLIYSALDTCIYLKKPTLNIIGARNTSLNSCKCAKRISRELGEQGHVVISGMLRGIDFGNHSCNGKWG